MYYLTTRKKSIKKYIPFVVAALVMIVPVLIYAAQSVPGYDDFTNATADRQYWAAEGSSFFGSVLHTKDVYLTIGGYYFAAFINFFVSPLLRWGITGLRVVNITIQISFFLSTFFLVHTFVSKKICKNSFLSWVVYLSLLFLITNVNYSHELSSWYCVLIAYVTPLSIMMFNLGLVVLYDSKEPLNKKKLAIISLLAFLVSGSGLNITALNCGLFFLITVYHLIFRRKNNYIIIPFLCALIGAIINVIAPGNYDRLAITSNNHSFFVSLKATVIDTLKMLEYIVLHTPFMAIAVILLIFILRYGVFKNNIVSGYHVAVGAIIPIVGTIIVNLPVYYGYANNYFPPRCVFVQDMTFFILVFFWLLHFAGWLQNRIQVKSVSLEALFIAVTSCLLFVVAICDGLTGDNVLPTRYMTGSLLSGRLNQAVEFQEGILEEIEDTDEEIVILHRDTSIQDKYFAIVGLQPQSDSWINKSVSEYYGKKSIYIDYADD